MSHDQTSLGRYRQQFGLGVERMAQLLAACAHFVVGPQNAIHGADRAMIAALVEQGGVDFCWREIGKARRTEQIEYGFARRCWQRARWTRPADGEGGGRARRFMLRSRLARDRPSAAQVAPTEPMAGIHAASPSVSAALCGASGIPSRSASFFWVSIIASARCRRCFSWAMSRRAAANSELSGLLGGTFGPRRAGVSAPNVPASRWRRHSLRADEYSPWRRRSAPTAPLPAARSASLRMASFSAAVNVRRRGRSEISGSAAVGAGTTVGLRPPSVPTPTAASWFGMTTRHSPINPGA